MTTREADKQKFCEFIRETATKKNPMSKTYHHEFRNLKAVSLTIEKKGGKVVQVTLELDSLTSGKCELVLIHPVRPKLPIENGVPIEWDKLEGKLKAEKVDIVEVHREQGQSYSVRIRRDNKVIVFIHCPDILNLPPHSE